MSVSNKLKNLAKKVSHFSFYIYSGIFIIAFFLLIGFLLSRPTKPTTTSSLPKHINVVNVTLSDNGFSPSTVTIHHGESIRWINNSSAVASVNSDDYPLNRLYPELNLGQFKQGMSLVHVFLSQGTYTYHNQYKPQQKGNVIVI